MVAVGVIFRIGDHHILAGLQAQCLPGQGDALGGVLHKGDLPRHTPHQLGGLAPGVVGHFIQALPGLFPIPAIDHRAEGPVSLLDAPGQQRHRTHIQIDLAFQKGEFFRAHLVEHPLHDRLLSRLLHVAFCNTLCYTSL